MEKEENENKMELKVALLSNLVVQIRSDKCDYDSNYINT